MPLRPHRTKVVEPFQWSLPPADAPGRELRTQLPHPEADTGKPPLLFVHGVGHGAWCFDQHWMAAAAAQGWPCYAVSLRGHGASAGAEQLPRATLRDYVHDVLQAITELPAPPVLVGHSMGALIVQRVLERYTAAPAAVLLAPAGDRHGLRIVARLARRRPWQLVRATVGRTLWFDGRLLVSTEVPDEVADAYAARQSPESPLAQYQVVLPRRRWTAACPVLVLGGGADEIVPPVDVIRTARRFGTRAVMFSGLGHDLMLEARWRQPLQTMLDWLERTTVRAAPPRAQPA